MANKVKGRTAPNLSEDSLKVDDVDAAHAEELVGCKIGEGALRRLPKRVEQCLFDGASIAGGILREVKVYDTAFRQCDFANLDARDTKFDRVEFVHCRLTGINLSESILKDVLFEECQSRLALFQFSRVSFSEFKNCDLREADFRNADLSGSIFSGCDLSAVDMTDAKLTGADIRGCSIEGIRMNAENAKGLVIDPEQAVFLIPLFGIKIRWK